MGLTNYLLWPIFKSRQKGVVLLLCKTLAGADHVPSVEIPVVGGPILIAAIATFHIIPSHVATGGFWITYFIERKALRENRQELLEFLKKLSLSILIYAVPPG